MLVATIRSLKMHGGGPLVTSGKPLDPAYTQVSQREKVYDSIIINFVCMREWYSLIPHQTLGVVTKKKLSCHAPIRVCTYTHAFVAYGVMSFTKRVDCVKCGVLDFKGCAVVCN